MNDGLLQQGTSQSENCEGRRTGGDDAGGEDLLCSVQNSTVMPCSRAHVKGKSKELKLHDRDEEAWKVHQSGTAR